MQWSWVEAGILPLPSPPCILTMEMPAGRPIPVPSEKKTLYGLILVRLQVLSSQGLSVFNIHLGNVCVCVCVSSWRFWIKLSVNPYF